MIYHYKNLVQCCKQDQKWEKSGGRSNSGHYLIKNC